MPIMKGVLVKNVQSVLDQVGMVTAQVNDFMHLYGEYERECLDADQQLQVAMDALEAAKEKLEEI